MEQIVSGIRIIGVAALLLALTAAAQAAAPASAGNRVAAVRIDAASAARLTGHLAEDVLASAPAISDFVQREPNEGASPSFRTEAHVLYDDNALYVCVHAYDSEPSKITGILTRRDTDSPSDWVGVAIDSYHDHRTAYEFAVNPAGVKVDKYRFNDGNEDSSWDAVWDVKVTTDDKGWRAEFRIPFSQLRFDPTRAGTFGLALYRRVGRLSETSTWPLLSKGAAGVVSSFGDLTGLELTRSPKRLEVVPYAVAQLTTEEPEAGNPFEKRSDPGASFGADVKFALTPGLTFTGAINPDFGQVEADPAVVNLTAFETFYNERRPFFVEGSGIFRFDLTCNDGQCTGLFYSRRIGRQPHVDPDISDEGYTSLPAQTTILGAGKLTGRVGSFSIGALNATTREETGQIADGGRRSTQVVEPLTNYSVVRTTREFQNRSSLGFMFTATNRRLTPDVSSLLPGQAYTGGVDWDARFKERYSLNGYWAGSTVRGSAEAIDELQTDNVHSFQRPDAGHVREDPTRTSLNGHSGQLYLSKIAGDHLRFSTGASYRTPGFEINDLGFLKRADEITSSAWVQWRQEKPSKHLRSYWLNFNQWSGWNFDGDRLYQGGNVNVHVLTRNNTGLSAGYNIERQSFDDLLTRGGPGGLVNGSRSGWFMFNSDDRRAVQYTHGLAVGARTDGSRIVMFEPGVRVRPTAALSISGSLSFTRNIDDAQWVEEVESDRDHYVFAHLDQTTVGIVTRINYTITPTLSIQIYAQPFVSAGAYSSFKQLTNGRAANYKDRYAPFAHADNPDFNYKSFRTTNVLRWEYRPGSTLFVVWQQGREVESEYGDFRFGRDFGRVFGLPARNVLLVKMAHWLNF
jgi:hypothetical protein